MRMVTLILLLNASSLALEQPGSMVRGMSGRRLLFFFDKLAISAAHASNRSVNPPPGLAHGTGNRPHPVHGTAEARAHLETDCNAQLLPALPRIPEIHGLDLPRRLQLQGGGEQVRGIHAPSTYPTGTTRQTYHPPQTAKGPYFHRFRQYQTIPH